MNSFEIALAFLEGLALIISPCILPVLPLILSTAVDGGKSRPFGIIFGFITSFTLFAMASRQIVAVLGIDLDLIKNASLILLFLFGVVLLSTTLSNKLSTATAGLSNIGAHNQKGGFFGGIGIGALIGLVWVPCAGPILAAVLVQVIRQQNDLNGFFIIFSFALGAAIPMLAIALTGRKLMNKLSFLNTHAYAIRKVFGALIIASVGLIYSGVDLQNLFAAKPTIEKIQIQQKGLRNPLPTPYAAPEFADIEVWLNSQPRTMESLKGKVVLIDFWTYSCINCVRTLPYVTNWHQKYKDKGLVIIGVHAPEFEFEKKQSNVVAALKKYNIQYPVAIDNMLSTWVNFKNRYWPAHYLINQKGEVVYTHFGEGEYATTEHNIRTLLGLDEAAQTEPQKISFSKNQTPETYLGHLRIENFTQIDAMKRMQAVNYTAPKFVPLNQWALNGNWQIDAEYSKALAANSSLLLNFNAKKVFLVMANNTGAPIEVDIKLNGELIKDAAGKDVQNGTVIVNADALYELIDQTTLKNGLLELTAKNPGLEVYAFTFGE